MHSTGKKGLRSDLVFRLEDLMDERRRSTRFKLSGEAEISHGDKKGKGTLRDLSVNGAFIAIRNGFEPYEDIDIIITVKNDRKNLAATLKGIVSRKDGDGIGVQFSGMDIAAFRVIRDLAELYAKCPGKIENDLKRLKITSSIQ